MGAPSARRAFADVPYKGTNAPANSRGIGQLNFDQMKFRANEGKSALKGPRNEIGADERGLYLRLGRESIQVPWHEVRLIHEGRASTETGCMSCLSKEIKNPAQVQIGSDKWSHTIEFPSNYLTIIKPFLP